MICFELVDDQDQSCKFWSKINLPWIFICVLKDWKTYVKIKYAFEYYEINLFFNFAAVSVLEVGKHQTAELPDSLKIAREGRLQLFVYNF